MSKKGKPSSGVYALHAIDQLKNRYQLEIKSKQYWEMCQSIREQKGKFLFRKSQRITEWHLDIYQWVGYHKVVRLYYDTSRRQIVTFIPDR